MTDRLLEKLREAGCHLQEVKYENGMTFSEFSTKRQIEIENENNLH